MTVTDRAFIRVFDETFSSPELAPHVVFAARGMHASVAAAEGDVPAERNAAFQDRANRPAAPPPPAAEDALPFRPASASGHSHVPHPRGHAAHTTYLPSSFRGLVGTDGPRSAPIAPAAAPDQVERPAADRQPAAHRRPILEVVGRHSDAPAETFRPALEVDALRWPAVIERMLKGRLEGLQVLCDAMSRSMGRGESIIAFQSTSPDAGCTTMSLASARVLAETRRSVAVVDADFTRPGLAAAVGLYMDEGWETTLLSNAPLIESVIQSLADGIAIVPLAQTLDGRVADAAMNDRLASALQLLAGNFDFVLVDVGTSAGWMKPSHAPAAPSSGPPDACVLVHAFDEHASAGVVPNVDLLCPLMGVVENLTMGDAA